MPSYTTNNGASWTATNLPAFSATWNGFPRAYRLAADRKNPNKVYAYDSGGAPWSWQRGKIYVSNDGGHTFALSQPVNANLAWNAWRDTSMAVNPNAEGDLWLADGTCTTRWTRGDLDEARRLCVDQWHPRRHRDRVGQGTGRFVVLGRGLRGRHIERRLGHLPFRRRGATWARFNDDAHQFGDSGVMAGDWNTYGGIYVNGAARGLIYSN